MPSYLAKPTSPRWQPKHLLGNGLKFFLPVHGPADIGSARDCVGGFNISATSSARTGNGGIICNANGKGFQATTPANLRINLPITVACQIVPLGSPNASAGYFGMAQNSAGADPYSVAHIINNAGFFSIVGNNNGVFWALNSTVSTAGRVGRRDILVGVLTATTRTLYLNGVSIATSSGSFLNPTYQASALVAAGFASGTAINSNIIVEGAGIWNRALSLTEVQLLQVDFFAPVRPTNILSALYLNQSLPISYYPSSIMASF